MIVKVLEHAGVYKRNQLSMEAFDKFMNYSANQITER